MITVVIKGSIWRRGNSVTDHCGRVDPTRLLSANYGTLCCLGLSARACGISDEAMHGCSTPSSLAEPHLGYPWIQESAKIGNLCSTKDASTCMRINDDEELSDDERIDKLRPIFKRNGQIIRWLPNA